MPIKLEIVAETPQEFANQLLGALAVMSGPRKPAPTPPVEVPGDQVPPAKQAEAPAPSGKKTRKAPAAKTGGDMPDEKPEEVEALTPAPAITQADVKTSLIALLEAKGDDAPPAVLKEFGAAKISELKQADYAKVIARVEAMMAEKDK